MREMNMIDLTDMICKKVFKQLCQLHEDDRISLTDWECDFIDNIEGDVNGERLTEKQKDKLLNIAEKYHVKVR